MRAMGELRCLLGACGRPSPRCATRRPPIVAEGRGRARAAPARWSRSSGGSSAISTRTVTTRGELGTVANWQQHVLPRVFEQPAREIGQPSAAGCRPTPGSAGRTRARSASSCRPTERARARRAAAARGHRPRRRTGALGPAGLAADGSEARGRASPSVTSLAASGGSRSRRRATTSSTRWRRSRDRRALRVPAAGRDAPAPSSWCRRPRRAPGRGEPLPRQAEPVAQAHGGDAHGRRVDLAGAPPGLDVLDHLEQRVAGVLVGDARQVLDVADRAVDQLEVARHHPDHPVPEHPPEADHGAGRERVEQHLDADAGQRVEEERRVRDLEADAAGGRPARLASLASVPRVAKRSPAYGAGRRAHVEGARRKLHHPRAREVPLRHDGRGAVAGPRGPVVRGRRARSGSASVPAGRSRAGPPPAARRPPRRAAAAVPPRSTRSCGAARRSSRVHASLGRRRGREEERPRLRGLASSHLRNGGVQ